MRWLDQHIDLEKNKAVAGRVEGLKLDGMRALCDVLGDPQADQPTIHLTGTNGKGSVARMVTALLAAHDLAVGTYTSPHLERINERISRNGEPIADDALAALLTDLSAIESLLDRQPSYFEILTAAAFRWFSDEAVAAAVVEVGLLGRWDSTNVVDGVVAVLTNVGHDHTDGKGDWRRRIAEEKSGIVKEGSTFVLGETDPALADVFDATPAALIWRRGVDFACVENRLAVGGRLLDLRTPGASYDEVFLSLHGAHQGENAAVAVAAAEAFFGRPLESALVAEALASVRNPGRFEVVQRDPLLILDGAHNRDGAIAAMEALAEGFRVTGVTHLVMGVLDGRDPRELLDILDAEDAASVVCCTPESPRALPAAALAALVEAAGGRPVIVDDVADAVQHALDRAAPDDIVLVTGSLYTVGDARAACRRLGLVDGG
ncbi:MAG: bifunctional folylpolyglutamate synthase/dihydrofolate synthase [Acidimicrobiales bacterium]